MLCVDCFKEFRRRNIPSKQQLLEDAKTITSWTAWGKKYGVSDNAVRKWVRSYDLPENLKLLKLMGS